MLKPIGITEIKISRTEWRKEFNHKDVPVYKLPATTNQNHQPLPEKISRSAIPTKNLL